MKRHSMFPARRLSTCAIFPLLAALFAACAAMTEDTQVTGVVQCLSL